MTPFKALYGRDPPTLVRYQPEITDVPTVHEKLTARDELLRQLKDNLMKAQTYMKNQADKKRQDVNLQVGDLVLVKLQHCNTLSNGTNLPLSLSPHTLATYDHSASQFQNGLLRQ